MGHPLGVLPELDQQESNIRAKSLGNLSKLNDELLVNVLSLLTARDLARITAVSRALYCFGNYDELWKGICLEVSFLNLLSHHCRPAYRDNKH